MLLNLLYLRPVYLIAWSTYILVFRREVVETRRERERERAGQRRSNREEV
jgi:hypothetical protein